jgi:hypothetical protein
MESYKVIQRLGVGTYGSAYLVSLKKDPGEEGCYSLVASPTLHARM